MMSVVLMMSGECCFQRETDTVTATLRPAPTTGVMVAPGVSKLKGCRNCQLSTSELLFCTRGICMTM